MEGPIQWFLKQVAWLIVGYMAYNVAGSVLKSAIGAIVTTVVVAAFAYYIVNDPIGFLDRITYLYDLIKFN